MATALLAALTAGSLAAGCTAGGGSVNDGRPPAPEGGTNTPSPGSALAVKIDNVSAARPQTGLDAADIVYAERVEGGLSRLMAVYATKLPEAVGPVRSARESDLELLRQFHEPTLAFSGAQSKLLPLIEKAPLNAVTPSTMPEAYFRGKDKPSPHNLYLRPQRLMGSEPRAAALTTGYEYGALPEGGKAETTRTVRFPTARFTFDWSASRGRWLVSMDGTPTVTTDGKRVAASTVVVQYVKIRKSQFGDFLGNNSPYTETVGSGRATILRDGRAFDTDWKRASDTDGTKFTMKNGEPMTFARGQVWVVFAKA
jgi:hypothetical protein